HYYF
ncbi:hypothetical protein ACTFIT_007049, partial [Dictyostelium discoideum]